MKAKGAGLLKVTGILMIIGGSISLIISIIAVFGIAALIAMGFSSGLLYASGFMSLASAVVQFVAGIVGVVNAQKPEKTQTCVTWGMSVAILCVTGCILSVVAENGFPFFSFVLGLILPVLYMIGAAKNRVA